jgi:hypothetical protein
MRFTRNLLFRGILICTVLFTAYSAMGQTDTATISGQIVDSSGAVMRGAGVELHSTQQGTSSTVLTNDAGIYVFASVQPGEYSVTVRKPGFKQVDLVGVVANVQDHIEQNFRLQVGSVSESVTVEAGTVNMDTTDGAVSTVVNQKFVENIPLNGRSLQDLISLTPGVVTQSPQSGSSLGYNGDFSVNGQRTESNYYTIDGVSGNTGAGNGFGGPQPSSSGSVGGGTALGTTQSLIALDAVQEFRVQTSTYSAEFGHAPGGQFSIVTKSGTKSLHGSVYDYLRNDVFDANDWFNDYNAKRKTALRQNDFGGTWGGPIVVPKLYEGHDDTFFFVSYEGLRLTQPTASSVQYVPDTYMRAQAAPALQPILNAYPLPNGTDYGSASQPSLAQFIEPFSLPSQIDSTSVRADHTFRSGLSGFVRYMDTPSVTHSRTLSVLTSNPFSSTQYTLGLDALFAHDMSNQFRLEYAGSRSSTIESLDSFGGATPVDLAAAVGAGPSPYAEPYFEVYIVGVGLGTLNTQTSSNSNRQWNAIDTFVLSRGRHEMRYGFDYRRIESPQHPTTPLVEGIYKSAQSLALNKADTAILSQRLGSAPIYLQAAAFFNDQWRVAHNLNLSLGVRWEINPPPTEANGPEPYTLRGSLSDPASLQLAPQGTPLWATTWYNLAPRLGFAWTARNLPGHETVVRSGFGVFYDTAQQTAGQGSIGIGFIATKSLSGISLPVSSSQLDFAPSATPPYTASSIYAFPSHLQLPYTLDWSAALQQAVGEKQSFTISYLGAAGRRLTSEQYHSLSSLNPDFGTVITFQTNNTSSYDALQLQFQRSVTAGLQALASYTWSHSLDFGSTYAALPATRGNSDFDVRHNLAAGLSWDLPHPADARLAGLITRGWGIDGRVEARTAFPITIKGNLLTDPTTGSEYYGNVNLNLSQTLYLYSSAYPGGRVLNKAAFSTPPAGQTGNAPRNYVRGFGELQFNTAVRREFPLTDRLRLQFRAEAFNVFNHPNFGYVDPGLTHVTFGQATQMLNASLGTMATQYQQGGPRSMQFALHLQF